MLLRADDVGVIALLVLVVHVLCKLLGVVCGIGLDLTTELRSDFNRHTVFRYGSSAGRSRL
jgi:hypothetical protein